LLDGHGTYEVEFKYQTPNRAGKPVPHGTYIKGVELACPEPNTLGFAGHVGSKSSVNWAWFAVGCVLLVSALAFAAWGFSLKQLAEDQRRILLWVLPLASGVAAGAFAGSMSVRAQGFLPGLVITATGGFGVWLLTFFFLFPKHPDALSISQNGESIIKEAGGLLVDLDPVSVQWTFTGKEEMVSVLLENVDSQKRSAKRTVPSNVRAVEFDSTEVLSVASNRKYHGKNRIRSVIEWTGGTSLSDSRDFFVGIEVELRFGGRALFPDGKQRTVHTLLATIDHSTEQIPRDYSFSGDFACMTPNGPLVVPLSSTNSNGEVTVPGLARVEWHNKCGRQYEERIFATLWRVGIVSPLCSGHSALCLDLLANETLLPTELRPHSISGQHAKCFRLRKGDPA
jgi:hypothetical protein